jgi:hypothetical protein
LHEITFNRAKEEPVPASFPGVVLLFYQTNLWSASTKIALPGVHCIPVIQFLMEHFTAHCLFGGDKQPFKRHKPGFFMDLPPKHFERIL